MAFNARWELDGLGAAHGANIAILLRDFLDEFGTLTKSALVYRLDIADNGNHFVLTSTLAEPLNSNVIPPEPGFYSIFTPKYVVYLGEAGDLRRRFFQDPDNTANSNWSFSGQGRAILMYLMHHRNLGDIGIEDLLVQVYPASSKLATREDYAFGLFYQLDVERYRKSFEGVLALVAQSYHGAMVARAVKNGLVMP